MVQDRSVLNAPASLLCRMDPRISCRFGDFMELPPAAGISALLLHLPQKHVHGPPFSCATFGFGKYIQHTDVCKIVTHKSKTFASIFIRLLLCLLFLSPCAENPFFILKKKNYK